MSMYIVQVPIHLHESMNTCISQVQILPFFVLIFFAFLKKLDFLLQHFRLWSKAKNLDHSMCNSTFLFFNFQLPPQWGTTLELVVSICLSVSGQLTNLTFNQLSRLTRLMKLSGLRQMGPRDMSMLCLIKRTMLGPCLGHIRSMILLFLQYLCFQMPEMAQIFTGE